VRTVLLGEESLAVIAAARLACRRFVSRRLRHGARGTRRASRCTAMGALESRMRVPYQMCAPSQLIPFPVGGV